MSTGQVKRDILPAKRQQALADGAVRISSSLSVAKPIRSILQIVCEEAAQIVGAHMATIGMTVDRNWAHAIQAISLSDKYAAWRGYEETPNGSGIYSLVCRCESFKDDNPKQTQLISVSKPSNVKNAGSVLPARPNAVGAGRICPPREFM